jgi:hypothetical protein
MRAPCSARALSRLPNRALAESLDWQTGSEETVDNTTGHWRVKNGLMMVDAIREELYRSQEPRPSGDEGRALSG